MSATSSPSLPRDREQKLYQVCLDSCIHELEKFTITRSGDRATHTDNPDNASQPRSNPPRTTSSPCLQSTPTSTPTQPFLEKPLPESAFPSPPPTPQQRKVSRWRSTSPPAPVMKRSTTPGRPPRGRKVAPQASGRPSTPSGYGAQNAPSSLAVQPAAAPVKINLKKAAVKVVRPTGPLSSVPQAAAPKEADSHEAPRQIAKAAPPSPRKDISDLKSKLDAKASLSKLELPAPKSEGEAALDTMFARLTSLSPSPTRKAMAQEISSRGTGVSAFSVEDKPLLDTPLKLLRNYAANLPDKTKEYKEQAPVPKDAATSEVNVKAKEVNVKAKEVKEINQWEGWSAEDLEKEYIKKAAEYLSLLPTTENETVTAHPIKTVIVILRYSFSPATTPDPESVEELKSKYLEAVSAYINRIRKNDAKAVTAGFVKQTLEDNNGGFLWLCVKLADAKLIVLENLDELVGLCKAVIEILPKETTNVKAPSSVPQSSSRGPNVPTTATTSKKPLWDDPMDKMSAWPAQEKRENVAGCRTCILQGVAGITSINQLQALVWGGRLESISLPEPGANLALVKFLTAEGCQKYFDATENGIEVAGNKKAIVFVERQKGPNSINDVMRHCIEGDASRCVRAYDADEDWSDMVLLKLAHGKSQVKREVDRIKRAKTSGGRYYIEFRFASIYHALNFKRALADDEDWEHCSIGYAPDPCETARGVHYDD